MPYDPTKHALVGVGPNPDTITIGQQNSINAIKRKLKRTATEAEKAFRQHIAIKLFRRTNQRIRFIEQKEFILAKGITFIVDFYFPKLKLVVEIDGHDHFTVAGREKDKWRTQILAEHFKIATVHFENQFVIQQPELVWQATIREMVTSPHATPSYRKLIQVAYLPFHWPK